MNFAGHQANSSTEVSAILGRIAEADKTAAEDCIDAYGNMVWAIAREQTDLTEEAEVAVSEIFLDIWQYAGDFDSTKFEEITFVFLIARRRLIKRLQELTGD